MGWGERADEKLFLDEAIYTIFPQVGDNKVDDGKTDTQQSAGAHPFILF